MAPGTQPLRLCGANVTANHSRACQSVQAPNDRVRRLESARVFLHGDGFRMTRECIDAALALYAESVAEASPADRSLAGEFRRLLHGDPRVFRRSHLPGHFTGSAWLVSADGQRVLLTHHRKLGRWLQLGGHADGDADLARVALREAGEESGLSGLRAEPAIYDLDRHLIPARGDEPAHWHYDVRYVVRATIDEAFSANEESLALAWCSIGTLAADTGGDVSLRRMATRWLQRQARP